MKNRSLSIVLALAAIILSSLACELNPISPQPITRKLQFISAAVTPAESDGSLALFLEVTYTSVGAGDQVAITCYYQSASGVTEIGKAPALSGATEQNMDTVLAFSLTQPGIYQAYCNSSDGAQSSTAPFRISEPKTKPKTEPDPPSQPDPQYPPQTPPQVQNGACQWQVSGTWNITQNNNFHPTFVIAQNGTTLSGTATLPSNEAASETSACASGTGAGSVNGNIFTFVVTCQSKTGGQTFSGTYTGTITEGRIDEPNGAWYGIGPSKCVAP